MSSSYLLGEIAEKARKRRLSRPNAKTSAQFVLISLPEFLDLSRFLEHFSGKGKVGNCFWPNPGSSRGTLPCAFLPGFSANQQNPRASSGRFLKRAMVEKNGKGINPQRSASFLGAPCKNSSTTKRGGCCGPRSGGSGGPGNSVNQAEARK